MGGIDNLRVQDRAILVAFHLRSQFVSISAAARLTPILSIAISDFLVCLKELLFFIVKKVDKTFVQSSFLLIPLIIDH